MVLKPFEEFILYNQTMLEECGPNQRKLSPITDL
jgi:hypothetical protein